MTKKVKRKAKKKALRFFVFGLFCFFVIGLVFTTLTKVWLNIYEKYKEKEQLEKEVLTLKEEEESLAVDVERLQDPDYVARYLREKYFYSKKGEYVIRIPDEDK